ncbi:DNA translocase [Saccharomycopsis crataegensis]|uniref:DNA translocase n=1 Tax=Saccharomycopsis crataegensis TaxID=43959 RepID=A0AAV5QRK5_9ASCO|nr:DNA translocase [Saccharomycopsis crataegensis]
MEKRRLEKELSEKHEEEEEVLQDCDDDGDKNSDDGDEISNKQKQDSTPDENRGDTVKRFKYLLSLSGLFRDFIDVKVKKDLYLKKVIGDYENSIGLKSKKSKKKSEKSGRRRKTEKEEDMELLHDEEEELDHQETIISESPSFIDGTLRDYQIQGLNWLITLHENCLSGILADEMGLGKTLQTISFLGYLRYVKGIKGPHIVIVPKSTLDNWKREFAKWTPDVNVLLFKGNKDERQNIIHNKLLACDFDVVVTSFETVIREKSQLKKFRWQYIVVDEAHRIKNEESSLSQIIRLFYSNNRLLITGTPLQNNLHELWALLNFLLPDVFGDSEVFDQWFAADEDQTKEEDSKMIDKLHQILSPFLLRRVKADVEKSLLPKKELNLYVGMSEMQVKWYKRLLEKDIDAVNGAVGKREGKTRLLNIVMQLRKCCNHPYLFEGAEPGPPYTTDEHLVYNSGKLQILDKLLKKFKAEGSRVLIFSQMSRLLDILEDYCYFRGYEYCRIDGSTAHEDRIDAIDEYNKPDSSKFVFLLTTRAGGLGINLTTANIVVLFDSDWNPQADLQAMDRAHRIGQKKQVEVYRFVTENAIEEKVLERATQKLRLDQLVIQQGRMHNSSAAMAKNKVGDNKDDLLSMIQHGAKSVFESDKSTFDLNEDIESILAKSETKTSKLNEKFNKLGLDDLQKFTSDSSAYEWNGENFSKKNNEKDKQFWINPSKRERKEQTYSVDGYYKDVLHQAKLPGGKTPKAPKTVHIQDHQFYPKEFRDLIEKETLYYKRSIGYRVPLSDIPLDDGDNKSVSNDKKAGYNSSDDEYLDTDDEEDSTNKTKEQRKTREAKRKLEQQKVNKAEPLTAEEEELKKKYSDQAFANWTRRDFTNFVHSAAKFGRHQHKQIAGELGNKTPEDVKKYSEVFWKNYEEIDGYAKYIAQIEAGEKKFHKINLQKDLLARKISQYDAPLQQLQIQYPPNNSKRIYTELEDRYLLVMVNKFGLTTENLYDKIKESLKESDLFKFDWFFQSRTAQELGRRTNTLLLALTREFEGPNALKRKREKRNKDKDKESDSRNSPAPSVTPAPVSGKRSALSTVSDGTGNKRAKV